MKINGTSNNFKNNLIPADSPLKKRGEDNGSRETAAASSSPDLLLRPMRTFKGHGMLEQYPANLTLAYVSGHEHRHKQKNQAEAGQEGKTARQEVSYSVQISAQGEMLATGGVTKSSAPSEGVQTPRLQSGAGAKNASVPTLLSPEDFERKIKEFHLARKKESYAKELRSASSNDPRMNGQNSSETTEEAKTQVSDFSEKKSNSLSEDLKKWNLQWKISQLEGEERKISREQYLKDIEEEKASSSQGSNDKNPEVSALPLPEEEHVDMSRVAPAAYHLTQRRIPNMVFTHGFGSAFEINNILNKSQRFQPNKIFPENLSIESKLTTLQTSALDKTATQLKSLNDAAGELSSNAAFNVRTSKTLYPELVNAKTSVRSPLGEYEISIDTLALPHKIISDEVSDPFAALGLSGSFKVNGYQVDVTAGDSLSSLRDKINYGEDVNKNGNLDYAEDMNGNGNLDVVEIQPPIKGNHTFIFEDVDFDGALDASEDVNRNQWLDGGTANTGVQADLQFNRLMIRTVKTGDHSLSLDDPDGLLLELGFLTRGENGKVTEKNQVRASTSDLLNSSPTQAQFSLNGVDYQRASNEVDDALAGTTLQLKETTSAAVSLEVKNSVEDSQTRMENFAREYNASMETINDYLAFQKTLRGNAIVQNFRAQLEDAANRSIDSLDRNINSQEPLGLELQKTDKQTISAFSLRNVAETVHNNRHAVSSYRAQGEGTVYSALDQLGIREKGDDTLRVESTRLATTLESFPEEVAGTLSGGTGASARMQSLLQDVVRDQGTLDLEKVRIQSYGEKIPVVGKALKETFSYQASMNLANITLGDGVSAYA